MNLWSKMQGFSLIFHQHQEPTGLNSEKLEQLAHSQMSSMNLTFALRVYQHQLHLSKMVKLEAWTQQRGKEKSSMEENHGQLLSTELMRNTSEKLQTHLLPLLPKKLRNSTMMASSASKIYWASSKKKQIVQCEYHIWRYLVQRDKEIKRYRG